MVQRVESLPLARPQRNPVEIEKSLDELSFLMDGIFRIPGVGWRFGLDAVIGLVPGIGDTATTVVSIYILVAAVRYRVPKITLLRMGLNIGIDYLLGAIPVFVDVFDAFWKSNQMNVALLKDRATVSSTEAKRGGRSSDWLFLGVIVSVLLFLFVCSLTATILLIRFFLIHLPS
jgi:Domain of unknown function (DUF4112)